jgi:hypothetical protein
LKAIINAHVYNTETADVVCDVSYGWSGSDLDWHETTLYRPKKGAFFLAGKGGPRSMWAEQHGTASTNGSGLRVFDIEEARVPMEAARSAGPHGGRRLTQSSAARNTHPRSPFPGRVRGLTGGLRLCGHVHKTAPPIVEVGLPGPA